MPVWKVRESDPPSRLIATKPLSPREKAIWLLPFDQKLDVKKADAVWLRNETMLPIVRHRCSQTHSPKQFGVPFTYTFLVVPSAFAGGPWEGSLNAKLDMICG